MHTYCGENNRRCFLPFVNGFEMNGGQCRHDDEARDETLSQESMPTPTATSSTCIKTPPPTTTTTATTRRLHSHHPKHDNPLTYVYVFILFRPYTSLYSFKLFLTNDNIKIGLTLS